MVFLYYYSVTFEMSSIILLCIAYVKLCNFFIHEHLFSGDLF